MHFDCQKMGKLQTGNSRFHTAIKREIVKSYRRDRPFFAGAPPVKPTGSTTPVGVR